jgi:hypothetical protein
MTSSPKPNESLYPDILFHFTKKDLLFEILTTTFRLSYAREKIYGPTINKAYAVPMVSFCDLKLSELKAHMGKYGSYGIGLTKDWANKNGLNPVLYLSRHCEFTDEFIQGVNGIHSFLRKSDDENEREQASIHLEKVLNTYRYIKNYESDVERDGVLYQDVRHADEREWRYVPSLSLNINYPISTISRVDTKDKKRRLNATLDHIRLSFKPDDIKYLIIDNENEISEVIKHLKKAKERFDDEVIEKLISRILTYEQIKKDI